MAWFKKRPDPISERERALNAEIAALEAEIKRLDNRLQSTPSRVPIPDSTPRPAPATAARPTVSEPVFEKIDQELLKPGPDSRSTPEHYNDLGMRKYDLPALLRRIRDQWRGPSTTNPKLVSYLAAGGIQGLRPMRYEKRVARNRFIALALVLFLMLLGIIAVLRH